jgi:hypothetical protein
MATGGEAIQLAKCSLHNRCALDLGRGNVVADPLHKTMFLCGGCPVHDPEKCAESGKLYWDGHWPSDQYPTFQGTNSMTRSVT